LLLLQLVPLVLLLLDSPAVPALTLALLLLVGPPAVQLSPPPSALLLLLGLPLAVPVGRQDRWIGQLAPAVTPAPLHLDDAHDTHAAAAADRVIAAAAAGEECLLVLSAHPLPTAAADQCQQSWVAAAAAAVPVPAAAAAAAAATA
jgi:hypothetical protein